MGPEALVPDVWEAAKVASPFAAMFSFLIAMIAWRAWSKAQKRGDLSLERVVESERAHAQEIKGLLSQQFASNDKMTGVVETLNQTIIRAINDANMLPKPRR